MSGPIANFETVIVHQVDQVARVTINRPGARNAINVDVQRDLVAALDHVRSESEINAVIFTGAGDRAFVAGADIRRLRAYTRDTALAASMQALFDEIEGFEKPTIAAINGFALGGGCELAMACDIRIASENARIGLPETALGIIPSAGGTQRLTRIAGLGLALDLILTGRLLTAAEAMQAGLVSRVTAPEDLLAVCHEVAQTMLQRSPHALRLAKLVVRAGGNADQATGQVIERLAQAILYETEDKQEGVDAFLEKRPAQFRGR